MADSPTDTGLTYTTSRGEMRVYQATSFTTTMTFGGVLPALPDLPIDDSMGIPTPNCKPISMMFMMRVETTITRPIPAETYWEGKISTAWPNSFT